MKIGKRFLTQAIFMLCGLMMMTTLVACGLRGAWLGIGIALAMCFTFTGMDAVRPGAKPFEGAWLRRTITGNLIYVAIVVTIFMLMVGMPEG